MVIAHAPLKMPLWQIERFLWEKSGWIAEKRALLQSRAKRMEQFDPVQGGKLPYLGGTLFLQAWEGKTARLDGNTLYLPEEGSVRAQALKWLQGEARRVLPLYVDKWSKITGLKPSRIGFGYAQKRWGSMSSKGSLRLNVALMHCAPRQIDYIVVHELTHIKHMNHSPAFHAAVEAVLPGAAQLRKEVKALSGYLELLRE